jgi:endonuclease-3
MQYAQPAGLGNVKASRIQHTLAAIQERTGTLSLDHLETMPLEEVRAWRSASTASGRRRRPVCCSFALGKPALPVDTHVHRVSLRLGLIALRTSAEQAHALLEAALPPDAVYAFH